MSRFKNWLPPIFDTDGFAYSQIGERYGWRCQYKDGLKLGKDVDIGCFTYINAKYGVTIEKDVQIGSHCSIYSDNSENQTNGNVFIGEGSLIGSHCLILPNAVIKPFSKIKAFSVIKGEINESK
jgi:acetyltransferase-like isoleucine patch superfamily enzyme